MIFESTLRSRFMAALAISAVVVALVTAVWFEWWAMAPALVVALAVSSLSSIHVRADQEGLHVKYGKLPWPQTNIGIGRIKTASAIDVRPMRWGGWGYRGSLTVFRRAAVVLRAGPGIRLDLHKRRVFVVTVDEPEQAVAILNAEIDRLAKLGAA